MELESLRKESIFSTKEFLILEISSRTVLQNKASSTAVFSHSWQSIYVPVVHGAQPIRIKLSIFPFSLFLARGKHRKRKHRETLLLCTIIFFFSNCGVLPCFISHRVIFIRRKNWRELYKKLTVLSSFDAYTQYTYRTRFNKKINVFLTSWDS